VKAPASGAFAWKRRDLIRWYRRESDTGLVLVLTIWLEEALTDLLRAFLVKQSAPRLLGRMNGRLEQKIALLDALGLFYPDERHDAEIVNTIRNRFAHRALTGTFRDGEVGELTDKLHFTRRYPGSSRRQYGTCGVRDRNWSSMNEQRRDRVAWSSSVSPTIRARSVRTTGLRGRAGSLSNSTPRIAAQRRAGFLGDADSVGDGVA
jgi:hypothetical protein